MPEQGFSISCVSRFLEFTALITLHFVPRAARYRGGDGINFDKGGKAQVQELQHFSISQEH